MTEAQCVHCGETKPLSEFRPDGRLASGCMDCYRAARRERYRKNRGRILAQNAAWRERNRDQHLARRRDQSPEQKAKAKEQAFLRAYGITIQQRDNMLAAQRGICALPGCGATEPGMGRDWATDHDHSCCPGNANSCGKCIRGILCNPCNMMLGLARDSEAILTGAIQYLRDNQMTRRAASAA